MRTSRIPLALITGVLAATALVIAACGADDEASQSDEDRAVAEAQEAYDRARTAGADLQTGPCVAESLTGLPDWVADVAHDPRQDIDDDPANQCQRYRDGEAHHFVELDPEGTLIKAE